MLQFIKNNKNFIALASIQGGNAIIPLIMYPFLLSKIGAYNFSKIATLEAMSLIVLTFSLYSFDISGIKKINSAIRISNSILSRTYYSILYARIIIFLPCALILALTILYVEKNLFFVAVAWLLFPLGVVLQSSYFYQATNNNSPLALFVIIPRVGSCIITLLYTNENTSLIFASSLISASYFLSGLISAIYLYARLGFKSPTRISLKSITLIRQGKSLFIGGLSVLLYRGSNILLLTTFNASPLSISTYAIAEKYIKMLQAITFPITQIFAVKLVRELFNLKYSSDQLKKILWTNTKYQIITATIICSVFLLCCTIAAPLINLEIPEQAVTLIIIMLPSIFLGIANYMCGTILFSSLNLDSLYARIVLLSGIATILTSSILIHFFSSLGASIAYIFAELLLITAFLVEIKNIRHADLKLERKS